MIPKQMTTFHILFVFFLLVSILVKFVHDYNLSGKCINTVSYTILCKAEDLLE